MIITMICPFHGMDDQDIPPIKAREYLAIVEPKLAKRKRPMDHHKEEIEAIRKRAQSHQEHFCNRPNGQKEEK